MVTGNFPSIGDGLRLSTAVFTSSKQLLRVHDSKMLIILSFIKTHT